MLNKRLNIPLKKSKLSVIPLPEPILRYIIILSFYNKDRLLELKLLNNPAYISAKNKHKTTQYQKLCLNITRHDSCSSSKNTKHRS